MKNKYISETIRWETVLKDYSGSSLTTETPIIYFEDALGTMVMSGTGTYGTIGTYYHEAAIGTGWGTGPGKYWWFVAGDNGTAQDVVTNEIFILNGTSEPASYVYTGELESYYDRIGDYFGDHTQDKLTSVYHRINRRLESLNINTPRQKNSDGLHDASLRDWNAWWGVYYLVHDWEANRTVEGDADPWYKKFWNEGERIYKDIKDKKIIFRDQVSPSEAGIGVPSRTAGSSVATMCTNWDNSYGKGFQGADFERTWKVSIVGTGTSGGMEEALATWSDDGGLTTEGTITTSNNWVSLGDEVYVRFTRGTSTDTTGLWQVGDVWEFTTHPTKQTVGGFKQAKSY